MLFGETNDKRNYLNYIENLIYFFEYHKVTDKCCQKFRGFIYLNAKRLKAGHLDRKI